MQELLALVEERPDINSVPRERLESIPWLSAHTVDVLMRHRSTKPIQSFDALTGLDSIQVSLIRRLFRIEKSRSWYMDMRHRIVAPLQQKRGQQSGHYRGSPLHVMHRVHFATVNGFKLGLVAEKDSGESSWYDLLHGYCAVETEHTAVMAGRFLVQSGYGLCFWRSFRQFHNIVSGVYLPTNRLTVDRSCNEWRKSLGIAIRHRSGPVQVIVFATHMRMDATLDLENIRGSAFDDTQWPADWDEFPQFDPQGVFVAEVTKTGEAVGYAISFQRDGNIGYLSVLAVIPAYQRRGIARALTWNVVCYLRTLDVTSIQVDAYTDSIPAVSLYKSVGFRTIRTYADESSATSGEESS